MLLKQGQYIDNSFFVLKGCVRSFYTIDGEEKTTSFYTEMDSVIPHSIVSGEPSEYSLSCVEDSILVISNPSREDEILKKFPKFETMCHKLSEELLVRQQMDFDSFKLSSPEQRYLTLVEKRPDLIQRVPQYQLASFLGVKPQSLSRLRNRVLQKSKD